MAGVCRSDEEQCYHAGNRREVHFHGVTNVKLESTVQRTMKSEYLVCFWCGYRCVPNRNKPIGNTEGTLLSRYEETQARLEKN